MVSGNVTNVVKKKIARRTTGAQGNKFLPFFAISSNLTMFNNIKNCVTHNRVQWFLLWHQVFATICHYLSPSITIYHYLPLSITICHYLSLSVTYCQYLSLSTKVMIKQATDDVAVKNFPKGNRKPGSVTVHTIISQYQAVSGSVRQYQVVSGSIQ